MKRPVVTFQVESELSPEYRWVLTELGVYAGFECRWADENPDVVVAELGIADIRVSHFFRSHYLHNDYSFSSYFQNEPLHYCADGTPDYLSTCFYMLSCLQEYNETERDQYDRFPYGSSWQSAFNAAEKNLVADYFERILEGASALKPFSGKQKASTVWLTHDIDLLHSAWKEQRKPLLKKGKWMTALKLGMDQLKGTHLYAQLPEITKPEEEVGARSTFFWLTREGRSRLGIAHADYDIGDPKVTRLMQRVSESGHSNGLHKSAFRSGYQDEFDDLALADVPFLNRNHYLLLNLPDSWKQMEEAGTDIDTSLGFAEHPGFRAGYGAPFCPYNPIRRKPYNFLEVPLAVMDTTFKHYLKEDAETASRRLFSFLELNKKGASFSILWHNNYFFQLLEPEWKQLYLEMLNWCKENGLGFTNPSDILSLR